MLYSLLPQGVIWPAPWLQILLSLSLSLSLPNAIFVSFFLFNNVTTLTYKIIKNRAQRWTSCPFSFYDLSYSIYDKYYIRLWCHHIVTLFEFCLHHFVIGQTGGLSNRQKEHKKNMRMAAKKAKVARTQLEKKKKQQRAGKQFRGRKAWKWLETFIAFLYNVIHYIFWMAIILYFKENITAT